MTQQDKSAPKGGPPPQQGGRPPTERVGNTGRGAESAMRHLKVWEQRRASDKTRAPSDKPSVDVNG